MVFNFVSFERDADKEVVEAKATAAALLSDNTFIVEDFPHPGVRYLDFYRTFDKNPAVRRAAVECLVKRYEGYDIDAIAGIGNGGFGLASCIAFLLGLPLHPIRKASDTVHNAFSVSVGMVYAERKLTLSRDIVEPGSKIILVDDTVASGGTTLGVLELIRHAGGDVCSGPLFLDHVGG